jgi:hypothetical protein
VTIFSFAARAVEGGGAVVGADSAAAGGGAMSAVAGATSAQMSTQTIKLEPGVRTSPS